MFITQKPSDQYELRIFVRGRPWIVKVDDQFLYHRELDNLRYAYVKNSLWPAVLEKALAKVKGNYEQLEGGFPANMMGFLTGVPIWTYTI